MSGRFALTAKRIFDGERWHDDAALVLANGKVEAVCPAAEISASVARRAAKGALVAPGFVDLQVNGGGGALLNDQPTVDGIRTICAAHARFGTTALFPTLITDTREVTARAIEAGAEAARAKVPGFAGLHLEGPHLALSRKGAHDPKLIRPMEDADLAMLIAARRELPALMVTVAVESATIEQVRALAQVDVLVSLGHTDAAYAQAKAYAGAGARLVTHLFNAMSPLAHREPGLVGAALDMDSLSAGLIADGFHVDPAAIRIALRAKAGPGSIFLVTDAMSTIGTDMTRFELNGRTIYRKDGRLTLDDGTLAGADIDMAASVRFMHDTVGIKLDEALRMASTYPAKAASLENKGTLAAGKDADFIELDDGLRVARSWIGGAAAFGSEAAVA